MALKFRGLMAPVMTPFKNDLSLNLDVIQGYAKFLASSKIMGILVNGSTGEGPSMTVVERKLVTETWVEAVRETKQHLMVQIGGGPLPYTIELAKHAESVGADSLLCLPNLYFKPTTSEDLIRYLRIIGETVPRTPLLYYHIPRYTGVNIHMGQFLNKVKGQIPNFNGIKFTSTALDEGVDAVRADEGKYAVFLGPIELMAGAFILGFNSSIATPINMFPQLATKISCAVKESKLEEAQKTQHTLTKACSIITKHGAWIPAMKAAMSLLTPINVGPAREPWENLNKSQIKEMESALKTLKLI